MGGPTRRGWRESGRWGQGPVNQHPAAGTTRPPTSRVCRPQPRGCPAGAPAWHPLFLLVGCSPPHRHLSRGPGPRGRPRSWRHSRLSAAVSCVGDPAANPLQMGYVQDRAISETLRGQCNLGVVWKSGPGRDSAREAPGHVDGGAAAGVSPRNQPFRKCLLRASESKCCRLVVLWSEQLHK